MSTAADDLRKQAFEGKTLQQNLRDIVARGNTGYAYAELKDVISTGDDLLDDDELEQVDKTVNILAHLCAAYADARVLEARIDQIHVDFQAYNTELSNDESELIAIRDDLLQQAKLTVKEDVQG